MKNFNELFYCYENLNKENVGNIIKYYSEDAFFKDPFNEVNGSSKIKHIFDDMFIHLENPRFVFIDKLIQDNQAFVTWDFVFIVKNKTYTIHGSSHLKLNDDQKIVYHRDYWDVGEELLLKVPLIKNLYSLFRKKIASS